MRFSRVISKIAIPFLFLAGVAAADTKPKSGPGSAGVAQPAMPIPACQRKHPNVRITPVQGSQGSSIALIDWAGTTTAIIADEDDAVLQTIDIKDSAPRSATPLSGTPSQLIVLPDGRIAVALRDKNRIQLLEPTADPKSPLSSLCEIDVAAEPVGLAATQDRLLVTSGWGRTLTIMDIKAMMRSRVVSLPRDPRGVIVDDAGKRAFVSHVVGGSLSIVDLASPDANNQTPRVVSLDVTKKLSSAKPVAQKGAQGFALAKSVKSTGGGGPLVPPLGPLSASASADEPRVFVPMAVADPGEQQVSTSGYGSGRPGPAEVPFVGVVGAQTEKALVGEISGDDLHRSRECLLPRAATFLRQRQSLLVACMGIDMLVELDTNTSEPARKERSRFRVAAGPTGIAVDAKEQRAVVWSQFDHAATIVTLSGGSDKNGRALPPPVPTRIDIARRTSMSAELMRGRVLFHKTDDTRLSRDGRACASCHPDGREDSLTWSTPSGPRQTIMLAGRTASTAPYSWSGTNATLAEHVTGTFQRLGGTGMAAANPANPANPANAANAKSEKEAPNGEADLRALLAYVGALKTPTHGAAPAALAQRGKDIFNGAEQGCGGCHVGGTGTDGQKHQVSIKGASDGLFDTPSLRFVSGTAPYFHDGRFATLDEMLTSTQHQMGTPSKLSVYDRRALIAYLETL
jgi:cytochrome c peroxidase